MVRNAANFASQGADLMRNAVVPKIGQLEGVQQLQQATGIPKFVNDNIVDPALATSSRVNNLIAGRNTYAQGRQGQGQVLQDVANVASVIPGVGVLGQGAKIGVRPLLKTAAANVPIGVSTSIGADMEKGRDVSLQNAALSGALTGGIGAAIPVTGAAIKGVRREAAAGFPQLQNEGGYISGSGSARGVQAEVSDAGMKFKKSGVRSLQEGNAVHGSDVIEHKELKADYKHLFDKNDPKSLKIVAENNLAHPTIDKVDGVIRIPSGYVKDLDSPLGRKAVTHEIQHAIDAFEGRVSGTSPGAEKIMGMPEDFKQAQRVASILKPEVENLAKLVKRGNLSKNEFLNHPTTLKYKEAVEAQKGVKQISDEQAMQSYLNNEGEVRARTVADRSMMKQKDIDANPLNLPRIEQVNRPQPRFAASKPFELPNGEKGVQPPNFSRVDPTVVKNARGDFAREAQTLNPNNLDLDNSQRAKILEMTTQEVKETLSTKEILEIAKRGGAGMTARDKEASAKLIAEQLNTRRSVVEAANKYEALSKSGANKDEVADAFLDTFNKATVSRMQGTDVARQLQARRIMANEMDTPMQKVIKLLGEAGVDPEKAAKRAVGVNWADANDVAKFYRDLVPAKFGDWIDAVRYNSMLSSPLTHAINIFSNGVNTTVIAPTEKALLGSLDFFASKLTGRERRAFAGEGATYLKGYVKATKQATENLMKTLRGTMEVQNLDVRDIPLAQDGAKGAAYKALAVPTKLLGGMDTFFRTLGRGGELAALELRQAKTGKAIKGIEQLADDKAAYRIFQQDLHAADQGAVLNAMDDFTGSIMALRNKDGLSGRIAKFVFPFVKTPSNIVKQGVEYSPVGWATLPGATNKMEQATKALMGSAVFASAYMALESGRVTWAEPTNAKQKAEFRAAGMQPYAIKIGNKWVAFNKLPPGIAFPFALTAGLKDAESNGVLGSDQIANILEGFANTTNFYADQSYLKSIGDTLAGVKGDKERMAQVPANFAQQLIPGRAFTGWIARMTDDTERKVDSDATFWQKQGQMLAQNYPGFRQDVPARLDNEGAPIPANNPLFNAISPIKVTDEREGHALNLAGMIQTSKDAKEQKLAKTEGTAKTESSGDLSKLEKKIKDTKDKLPKDLDKQSVDTLVNYARLSEKGKAKLKDDPNKVFELAAATYERDKKEGKLDSAEDFKRQKSLYKQSVTKDFSKKATELYSLSKGDLAAYFSQHPDDKLQGELLSLDQKMVEKRVIAKAKFGGTLAYKSKGGGKGKGKGRKPKLPSYSKMAANTSNINRLLRSSKVKKVSAPKTSKPKIAKTRKISTNTKLA